LSQCRSAGCRRILSVSLLSRSGQGKIKESLSVECRPHKPIRPVPGYELTQNSNEHFIKDIFRLRGQTPDDAARTARQLRLNELELYTQTERFIFELIQNADDMPKSDKGVAIEFILKRDFFLFFYTTDCLSEATTLTRSLTPGRARRLRIHKKQAIKGSASNPCFRMPELFIYIPVLLVSDLTRIIIRV